MTQNDRDTLDMITRRLLGAVVIDDITGNHDGGMYIRVEAGPDASAGYEYDDSSERRDQLRNARRYAASFGRHVIDNTI